MVKFETLTRRVTLQSATAAVLTIALLALPCAAAEQAGRKPTEEQAVIDAQEDAKTHVNGCLWTGAGYLAVLGIMPGVAGLIGANVAQPTPDASRLIGKSDEYKTAYLRAYEDAGKRVQVRHALTGCGLAAGTWAVAGIVVAAVIIVLARPTQ
jgi:hypothetical protein